MADRTSRFQAEREGVSNFSVRLQQMWSQGRSNRSDSDDSRPMSGAMDWSKCVSDVSDTNSAPGTRVPASCESPTSSCTLANLSNPPGLKFPTLTALSVAAAASQSVSAQSSKLERVVPRARRGTGSRSLELEQKLSTALAVIDGIPEQVREVLQQSARSLADDVQGEVADVRKLISNYETSEAGAEKALERLEVIPDLIIDSFGQTLTRMKDNVQKRVDGVIQELDSGDIEKERFARHLWSIPEEVHLIAEEAVEKAVQESQALATAQIEYALESAPVTRAENPNTLRNIKNQILASKISHLPVTHRGARMIAVRSVENAVAVVRDMTPESTGNETNQTVADQLLRAKALELVPIDVIIQDQMILRPREVPGTERQEFRLASRTSQDHGPALEASSVGLAVRTPSADVPKPVAFETEDGGLTNPGSRGHPELCPRPCLYYSTGQCANGSLCEFCHLPHPKRPVHLDKRHREVLKRMPFSACAAVILPILRERSRALQLSPEIPHLLDELERVASVGSGRQPAGLGTVRADRLLDSALRAMTFRSLLTTLHRTPLPPNSVERRCIDGILQRIRIVQDVSLDLG